MSIHESNGAERSRAPNAQRTQPLRHALHRAEAAVGAASPLDAWRRLGVLGRGRKSVWARKKPPMPPAQPTMPVIKPIS